MPTISKPELTEFGTPILQIWDRMYEDLVSNARLILAGLGYYAKHDLVIPDEGVELSEDEKVELHAVVRVLVDAAVRSERMRDGVLASTLNTVAKNPFLFFSGKLPALVQWEIANDYQRAGEKPGTYCVDIWGSEQIHCTYALETPTKASIAKAADAAWHRVEDTRAPGRPPNPANRAIAEGLGNIFRSSALPIVRRREPAKMYNRKVIYVETGLFRDFLELVLPPLQRHLREHELAPVTIDSVVRLATEES